jgi:Rrf2 family protein
MKFTKKSDYGLRLVTYLASKVSEGPISTRRIAEVEKIPVKFLATIVNDLRKAGYIESVAGLHGGIHLLISPTRITCLEIIEALEGEMALMDCMIESTNCDAFSNCKIHGLLGRVQLAMNEVLQGTTIDSLVGCPISK